MTRADGRAADQLRPVEITTGFIKFAEGSVLIRCGDTVVLCNASVEERVLGERTITVDCDVLQGDGGTRTASVTGGFVALALACRRLVEQGALEKMPLIHYVAGVSAGIVDDTPVLDLPYSEDSRAQVDLNCMMTEQGEIIELQGTGEGRPFTVAEQQTLVSLCAKGCRELMEKQKEIVGEIL